MSKKKVFFILFAAIVLLVLWWMKEKPVTEEIKKIDEEDKNEASAYLQAEPQGVHQALGLQSEKNIFVESDQGLLFSPAEVAEQQEWLRSRGNFFGAGETEYDSYDFAALHQLADSGDLHAMHKLAYLYLSDDYFKEYGFKAAEAMLMKAAVYGSSSALSEIGDFKHSQRLGVKSELEQRHFVVVSLGYFRAAELRGDYWGSITMRDPQLRINPIVLEPEEKESIESFAQAIYTELEAQRESLGLGAFDNSVPASVTKLFESLKRE